MRCLCENKPVNHGFLVGGGFGVSWTEPKGGDETMHGDRSYKAAYFVIEMVVRCQRADRTADTRADQLGNIVECSSEGNPAVVHVPSLPN